MRRLLAFGVLTCVAAVPTVARAGWIIEGSIGKGAQVSPNVEAEQLNLMVAPGFTIPFLRFELGLVGDLPDIEASKFNLELRPMVVIAPPILPIYGRAILAVTNLLEGDTTLAYGAALGLKLGLGPVGVFAEAGLLPRSRESEISWVIEGRAGVTLEF